MMTSRIALFVLSASTLIPLPGVQAAELDVLVTEDFQDDLGRWSVSDPESARKVWSLATSNDGANRFLTVAKESAYRPPYRSPQSVALLKSPYVGDFELTVRVRNTNPTAGGHRDLCLFWGYQDPAHFYYVHLGAQPDPHSCQVFVVDAAPRLKITEQESTGTPWDDAWHDVKVVRRVDDGLIEVYFDDMEKPCMVAHDKRFAWGQVGLGTFDDSGEFDDVVLRGVAVEPPQRTAPKVETSQSERGAVVTVDGQPFAEYLVKSGHQPAIWPLYGPAGKALTRSWPIGERLPHEHDDHPHHHSLWFTHGEVNGLDFWTEPSAGRPDTQIVHREFAELTSGDGAASIVTINDWTADGKKTLEDRRTWRFAADNLHRWIDFTVELKATDGPVEFGDTKEGTFATRVAGTMKVDEKLGGKVLNSHGQTNGDAWGRAAKWVD
ncbi:MAG: PmoA family protein, partial [Planctomycetales bacterium]|nr:PmoA family protein [Planctomycetales bacterium]